MEVFDGLCARSGEMREVRMRADVNNIVEEHELTQKERSKSRCLYSSHTGGEIDSDLSYLTAVFSGEDHRWAPSLSPRDSMLAHQPGFFQISTITRHSRHIRTQFSAIKAIQQRTRIR
jgi:hypothetical protein